MFTRDLFWDKNNKHQFWDQVWSHLFTYLLLSNISSPFTLNIAASTPLSLKLEICLYIKAFNGEKANTADLKVVFVEVQATTLSFNNLSSQNLKN